MAYTSTTLVQNYLQRTLVANETSFLAILIPAIKVWIDKKLSSTFDSASETTRYFDGGGKVADIDPCTDITAVKTYDNDGTVADTYTNLDDYVAEPVNDTIKREIVRRSGFFPVGLRRVGVTAKFSEYGDGGTVPTDIQTAATIMAAEVLNQGKIASSGGNIASESLEGHSISYDTSASALDGIASNNPNVKSILDLRRDLLLG